MTNLSFPMLHDYLESSSLDPLATSIGDESVDPQPFTQPSPAKLPRSSPLKGMRLLEDLSFSSPRRANGKRSSIQNSPSRNVSYQNLSPWRIRVTVEAEPEEMSIPTGRTTSRTMKVPLREDSPSTTLTKARRRKPQSGSSGVERHSTPVRGARSYSRTTRQNVTDLNITVLGDEEDLNEWSPQKSRKRGQTRSKKRKQEEGRQSTPDAAPNTQGYDDPDMEEGCNVFEDLSFHIRLDSDTEDKPQRTKEMEEVSPALRKIDLNRVSVRSRSGPHKGHKSRHEKDDCNISPSATQPPALVLESSAADLRATAIAYPTPTSSVQDDFDDVRNLIGGPTENHEGFDTILESEGFTMIDLDTIPSARHFLTPPSEQEQKKTEEIETPASKSHNSKSHSSQARSLHLSPISSPGGRTQPRLRPIAIPTHLTLPEGESDLSSTIPSSPPVPPQTVSALLSDQLHPLVRLTPAPYSSPQLPSPPRASAAPSRASVTQSQRSTPPKLVRVVRAGIALQGVLSPKISSEPSQGKNPSPARRTPRQRLDDLFEGFDSGTKRELRAGLRFGEELAKRQKSNSMSEITRKLREVLPNTQVWRGETTVQHTPTALVTNTSGMGEKRARQIPTATSTEPKRIKSPDGTSQTEPATLIQARRQEADTAYLDTQAKERQWQRERKAVSRQIQNANTSQVIVISSDRVDDNADCPLPTEELSQCAGQVEAEGADADESCGDIWLAEAGAHISSQHLSDGSSPDSVPISEPKRQSERVREVAHKLRRSLIPSPWKRGQDIDGTSTFVSNTELSGLLWKQPSGGVRFGAGALKRQKEGKTDAFSSGSQSTHFRLCESGISANSVLTSTHRKSAIGTDDRPCKEEALGGDHTSLDQGVPHENHSEEEDEAGEVVDKSISKIKDHNDCDRDESDTHEEDNATQNESSLPPQPIKIPVNFNDSTLSAPPLTPACQSSSPRSSRPSTPRSALKGSRSSLGLGDDGTKKVVFSSQSLCVDESGQLWNSRIKSLSPTPPASTVPGIVDCLQPALPPPTLSRGIPEPEPEPVSSKSWLGWLFGGSKVSSPTFVPPTTRGIPISCTSIPGVDGSDDTNADAGWVTTKSNFVASRRNSLQGKKGLPSFLRPPSYPSDPARDISVPLATSGEFTDVHFRTLHIIYRKSLRHRFHAPDAIRPRLQKMIGKKFTCDEGEYGYFAWEVDQDAVVVLERFMMEVELGWERKGHVEWEWSEKELGGRLFRIIVGEEVRREQSWRRGQVMGKEKGEMVVGVKV